MFSYLHFLKYFFDENTIMIFELVWFKISTWSLTFLKIFLFGMWLVYGDGWYTYSNCINLNSFDSKTWPAKWPKMFDQILQKDNDKIYLWCTKFDWCISQYKAFFGYRPYTYVLNSTEQMVYDSLCDQKWLFLLVYNLNMACWYTYNDLFSLLWFAFINLFYTIISKLWQL